MRPAKTPMARVEPDELMEIRHGKRDFGKALLVTENGEMGEMPRMAKPGEVVRFWSYDGQGGYSYAFDLYFKVMANGRGGVRIRKLPDRRR